MQYLRQGRSGCYDQAPCRRRSTFRAGPIAASQAPPLRPKGEGRAFRKIRSPQRRRPLRRTQLEDLEAKLVSGHPDIGKLRVGTRCKIQVLRPEAADSKPPNLKNQIRRCSQLRPGQPVMRFALWGTNGIITWPAQQEVLRPADRLLGPSL